MINIKASNRNFIKKLVRKLFKAGYCWKRLNARK